MQRGWIAVSAFAYNSSRKLKNALIPLLALIWQPENNAVSPHSIKFDTLLHSALHICTHSHRTFAYIYAMYI